MVNHLSSGSEGPFRKKRRKSFSYREVGVVEGDVLQQLSGGDLLMSFLLSAGSTRLMYKEAYKRARAKQGFTRAVKSLAKKRLIVRRGDTLSLSDEGHKLLKVLQESKRSVTEKEWDKHWWFIMYDIPVSLSPLRFELRSILVSSGFRKVQHSVWVHPHVSSELREFLSKNKVLAPYVTYVRVPAYEGLPDIETWKHLPTSSR